MYNSIKMDGIVAYFGFQTEKVFRREVARSMESSDGKCNFVSILKSPL